MNGLLIKEFLALKTNAKTYIMMTILFVMTGILTKNVSYISMMIGTLALGQNMTNMNYDESNNWNKFALTMPVDRKEIIKSKYIFSSILLTISFIIALVISYFAIYLRTDLHIGELFLSNYAVLYVIGIIASIILPVMFKFGAEKARLAIFGVIPVILFIIYIMAKFLPGTEIINFITNNYKLALFGSLVFLIMIIGLSYIISVNIYKFKDL